jgi:hypothetical protein
MVAAHSLFGRPLPIQSAVRKKEISLIQEGGKIKRQKEIDFHGPKNLPSLRPPSILIGTSLPSNDGFCNTPCHKTLDIITVVFQNRASGCSVLCS